MKVSFQDVAPVGKASRKTAILCIAVSLAFQTASQASPAASYQSGLASEARLDLFGARDHFRDAIRTNPQRGWKEHTAWFMYINGFHNSECLSLFEEVLPGAADRGATQKAITHLKEVLGKNPPKPRAPVARPRNLAPHSGLTARLQHARELYWSGNPGQAEAELQGLIKIKPYEPALRWEIAKVLSAMNRYDDAVDNLENALKQRPNEPELLVDYATAQALRKRRTIATRMLDDVDFQDPGPAHVARARAHHYCGEFVAAAREYEKALRDRPNDELVAHGLTECRLRNNDIAGARDLIGIWSGRTKGIDWSDRIELERELAASRIRTGGAWFHNSLDYDRWDVGVDFRTRPLDELEYAVAVTQGWFDQKGFSSIDRQTAHLAAVYQKNSYWSVYGNIGVNDYSHGWTSVIGGLGFMIRPVSTFEFSLAAEHFDVVDSEPVFGPSIYSMGSTIGAVGGEATMDALTARASWIPIENTEIFGSYRIGELTGDNRYNEGYASIAYTFSRAPYFRAGYAVGYADVENAAPVYTEGLSSTSYYYDPNNRLTHHLYIEQNGEIGSHFRYGTEARLILDEYGGAGALFSAYARYAWNERHALRLDARYFTQNHSRDRNDDTSGYYDAINLIAVYEYRF